MDIPVPTYERLPRYIRELRTLTENGVRCTSSRELAQAIGSTADIVRRDFVYLACTGRRGKGYQVDYLYKAFKSILGWETRKKMVIVGTTYLARALWEDTTIDYCGFSKVGVFSLSKDRCVCWKDVPVKPFAALQEIAFDVGIIATKADEAQFVADKLVESGAQGIWNFANKTIIVPAHVSVVYHDISHSLSFLAKQFQHYSC